mgnify:CR=1 FL=1
MKRVLFIDRDGTLVVEPPVDYQLDSFGKLEFVPKAIGSMSRIATLGFELVMATNQDGLGTESFPEETFWPVQNLIIKTLEGEGIHFDDVLIDRTLPEQNAPTRKPGTGMFGRYLAGGYDLKGSYVIGDRLTDVELARNLGARTILLRETEQGRRMAEQSGLSDVCALITDDWDRIWQFLRAGERTAVVERRTRETDIRVRLDLDGSSTSRIDTCSTRSCITPAYRSTCRSGETCRSTSTIRSRIRPSRSERRSAERSDRSSASAATASACRWTSAGPPCCSISADASS